MALQIVLLALLTCLTEIGNAQFSLAPECTTTQSCAPPLDNIVAGVIPETSNTCGLEESERFCFQTGSGGQVAGTCDYCDASDPDRAHGPELMTDVDGDRQTFWQSQTYNYVQFGRDPGFVNITFSLNKTYELRLIIITFHYIRPDSMVIYRSTDYGATFTPYQYFSTHCEEFYAVPLHDETVTSDSQEVFCIDSDSLIIPLFEGKVDFNPLEDKVPLGKTFYTLPDLHDWITFTDLRFKLDRLNTFGDERFSDPKVLDSYYYSISDIEVSGICKCNGHARSCELSELGELVCKCEHNTEGKDCERCRPFYQDRPWGRGTPEDPHVCGRCNCNNHTEVCHFDEDLYRRSNVSGGVCDGCKDNTRGRHCERCEENFYRNPAVEYTHPSTCIACDCDPRGTVNGSLTCHETAEGGRDPGKCQCKENVQTRTCSECKDGFYGLDSSNPAGCTDCNCNTIGTVSGSLLCDQLTGQCPCKANVQLLTCSECKPGFYSFSSIHDEGCIPCDCDEGGSLSSVCDPVQGDCMCRPNISSTGRKICDTPDRGFFCPSIEHLTFEAELTGGTFYSDVVEDGEREYTGLGFARLEAGEESVVSVDVPFSGQYRVVLQYSIGANTTKIDIQYQVRMLNCTEMGNGSSCNDEIPPDVPCVPPEDAELVDIVNLTLSNGSAASSDGFHCFIAGKTYTLTIRSLLSQGALLLDSVVLIPDVAGLKVFENQTDKLEDYINRLCIRSREMLRTTEEEDKDFCQPLTCAATFEIYNGALPCKCDEDGSVSQNCDPNGGQCPCKEFRTGRRCDECEPGRGGPDCSVDCSCNSVGSLSVVCDSSGECFCKPAVEGDKCDACITDHYDLGSGEGCQPCNCHPEGSSTLQCDLVSGKCQCEPGVEGDKCDRCIRGYHNLTDDGCKPCICDYNGTEYEICDPQSGRCLCKKNVQGAECGLCKSGYFGLSGELEEGCIPCTCDRGRECDLITNLRKHTIFPTSSSRFSLVDDSFNMIEGSNLTVNTDGDVSVFVDLTSLGSSLGVFLKIPEDFLQNLGDAFSFAQLRFTLELSTDHILQIPVKDIIAVIDAKVVSHAFADSFGKAPVDASIDLIGEGWVSEGVSLDITDMQRLIRGIESLVIRTGFSFKHSAFFSNITLEFTVLSDDPSLPLVEFKEMCRCPSRAYSGLSCEMCSEGYFRNKRGVCKPCNCSGNSNSCVTATGVCFDCINNTTGDHCEECLPKHYRDPRDGMCKPCPCPGTDAVSQYATVCSANETGHVTCLDCREGHAGDRCEVCAPGYYGDPPGRYGDHRPCVTCQCNNNADPMVFPICERLNGTCINCTNHSYGRECERCEPGYYGDAIVAKNCSMCSYCVMEGVSSDVCDPYVGDCICGEHVIGEFCDQCEDGRYNVSEGCPLCQCDPIGTSNLTIPCNHTTGQCPCKPGVGGRACDRCLPGFFNFTSDGCETCNCVDSGSVSPVCDASGRCPCKDTATGVKCDVCKDGYHNIEDGCIPCSQCYSLVGRQYQEAVSLYIHLINVINKLEEGDFDTSTLLLDPQIIHSIAGYRSVLEQQLRSAVVLLERETNATSILNVMLTSLEDMTRQSNELRKVIRSAGMSAEDSERFVTLSGEILANLTNTVRFIEQSLRESGDLLMTIEGTYQDTVDNLNMLIALANEINTTSHNQYEQAMEIFSNATDALDRAIRAYRMLCNAWDLQNATFDVLNRLDVDKLTSSLRTAQISFGDASADVPGILRQALRFLNELESVPVSDFEIPSFRIQLDNLHHRQNITQTNASTLDSQNDKLYADAQLLKTQADHLLNRSIELDRLAKELLMRTHAARATARRGYEVGQSSINETEALLDESKRILMNITEFQFNLRKLLSQLNSATNYTHTALNQSNKAQETITLIETIMADAISTIGRAANFSQSALQRASDANTQATETLLATKRLLTRSEELKNGTTEADVRLKAVDQRVLDDRSTISHLNLTAVDLEKFGQEVATRLVMVTNIIDGLSQQYNRIPFVASSDIDLLSGDISAAEKLVNKIEEDLNQLRVRQQGLDKTTEEMEGKYELLKQHRQLLRKIRDGMVVLDCGGLE